MSVCCTFVYVCVYELSWTTVAIDYHYLFSLYFSIIFRNFIITTNLFANEQTFFDAKTAAAADVQFQFDF